MENYSSVLLENAVAALNKLPGIGKKTALRQALFLLSQDKETTLLRNLRITLFSVKSAIIYPTPKPALSAQILNAILLQFALLVI